MDAEGYRKNILDCLERLGRLGGNVPSELAALKAQVKAEKEPRKLFLMYQSLKEVLAMELGEENKIDTSFYIQTPTGVKIKATNLAEGEEIAKSFQQSSGKRRKTQPSY